MNKKLKHGKIGIKVNGMGISIASIKCQTDFLANSELMGNTLNRICDFIPTGYAPNGKDLLTTAVATILFELGKESKEEVMICDIDYFRHSSVLVTNYYLHHDEKKLAIVQFKRNRDIDDLRVDSEEDFEAMKRLAKDIAMHIVAFSPDYLCMDDVNWEGVDLEIPSSMLNKPPSILEKIAKGKEAKYGKEHVLYNQPYAKDLKKTVWQVISEFNKEHACDIEIADFWRMEV